MYVKQLYTACLAEAAYYVESGNEVAIIDPLRDIDSYLAMAEERGARIRYIIETHFHADFVSGHLDLAAQTGATIVYGPGAQPAFEAHIAGDGERLPLGKIDLQVLHTPGHTLESISLLLHDEEGAPQALFTGDTLFIGDVGRPDLAVKADVSREDLARHLYHSLRQKIMPLPDHIIVYPGHGQGSACGKNMSSETTDILGHQKATNYALNPSLSEEEFIRELTTGLVTPPQYFPKNALLNKQGYPSLKDIQAQGNRALSVQDFRKYLGQEDCVLLDTRPQAEFVAGHIPGSTYIGIDGQFATWVGTLIDNLDAPILFIATSGRESEVVTRLARVGYHRPIGYLAGGLEAWHEAGLASDTLEEVEPEYIETHFSDLKDQLVDVRKRSEYDGRHIANVPNRPLDFIHDQARHFAANKKHYLYCAGGYRSVIAASILRQKGIAQVVNVARGFDALQRTHLPLSAPREVDTML